MPDLTVDTSRRHIAKIRGTSAEGLRVLVEEFDSTYVNIQKELILEWIEDIKKLYPHLVIEL